MLYNGFRLFLAVAEVSDQNFVNEDIEEEKANSGFITKRMRILEEDASNNDQVKHLSFLFFTKYS